MGKGGKNMKRTICYCMGKKRVEREIVNIPVRYVLAVLISVVEILCVIGGVVALCYYVPYCYAGALVMQAVCVLRIFRSDDNPDYKLPWLFFVIVLPIVGFMLYLMFYSRKLKKRYVRRLDAMWRRGYERDDSALFGQLAGESPLIASHAKMLTQLSHSHLFTNTKQTYFSSGEKMQESMLSDLKGAEKFIFLEYFIIEKGEFWKSLLDVLEQKAANGVTVRVVYDDIGCMTTLPGNYAKELFKKGIEATPFSFLRGGADSEFNNRSHRKLMIIDGKIGYTGGVNIADEYINQKQRFGHWKDSGLRLEGEAVWEMTRLFLVDYGINTRKEPAPVSDAFPRMPQICEDGYLIPFGDGPRPIYARRVAKSVIENMLDCAVRYAYITTPYLILDNDLMASIENAALRGVDVRIALPHIPDKKLVFLMTRSSYKRLLDAGVTIYEYEPGFLHAKSYLVDDTLGMIGTINLDYRSLVHHFENGVWMYRCASLGALKADMQDIFQKSIRVEKEMLHMGPVKRFVLSIAKIFAPMM